MHTTYATPQAIASFKAQLNNPDSIFYIDTCFGAEHNQQAPAGLALLSAMAVELRQSKKKINIIHFVAEELNQKAAQKERWACKMIRFVSDNQDIFTVRRKSNIEEELTSLESRHFADEALRRLAIADASQGKTPVLLTSDYGCAIAVATNSPKAQVFVLDRSTGEHAIIRDIADFQKQYKCTYISQRLPEIFTHSDIVLTSSALRCPRLDMLLEMLQFCVVRGQKLPVYIHESSLAQARDLRKSFTELLPYFHLVKGGNYGDETAELKAVYQTRHAGRKVMLVGSKTALTRLHSELDKAVNYHISQKCDYISYYHIGNLGSMVRISRLQHSAKCVNFDNLQSQLSDDSEETESGRAAALILAAARQGDVDAMGMAAAMYMHGFYVRQSPTMARLWRGKYLVSKKIRSHNSTSKSNWFSNLLKHLQPSIDQFNHYVKRNILPQTSS